MGVEFSVCPSIVLNNRERSPLAVLEGVNFTPGGQGVKLRMALWALGVFRRRSAQRVQKDDVQDIIHNWNKVWRRWKPVEGK
jgi:hypothetical protein